uniref:Protein kinase domain-containing protein n=1 Tax=Davidia involucrata TaxID=16924 RepID=A0A5B6YTX1_DAVIN
MKMKMMPVAVAVLYSLLVLLQFQVSSGQQAYVNNKQLDCDQNYNTTQGFVCNGASPSCVSYLTYRSNPPYYNSPATIGYLLGAKASEIARINNNISDVATIPAGTIVIVPVECSCSSGKYYQYNASYVLKSTDETYFSVANNTYKGLTTCQALIAQNPYNLRNLSVGMRLTIPLRCACPTSNQTAAGFNYLLSYLITWGDSVDSIADTFAGAGDIQTIYDANQLSSNDLIFPFTPLLVPLKTEPTMINTNVSPPPPPPQLPAVPAGGGSKSSSHKWVFVGVGVGAAFLVLSGCLVWFFLRRRGRPIPVPLPLPPPPPPKGDFTAPPLPAADNKSLSVSSEGVRYAIESLAVYKFEELEKATGNFGEGNRIKGSVYRGWFKGDDAAIKIMKGDVVSGEINILKQINHSNIIRLSGFCVHEGNTYLVYEYADKGSLSDCLHNLTLSWKQRVQIAYDVADALNYLHNYTNPPYVHKNLKSSNILVDGNMRAKISNFGLARILDGDQVLQLTRHVVGTYGYMPPEYIENGLVTPKLDVFAFGVVMLELLSGREAVDDNHKHKKEEEEEELLSVVIKQVLGEDNVREKLRGFMDVGLQQGYPLDLAYSMAQLANKCVAHDLNSRPSIPEVFMTLSKIRSSSLDWDPSDELERSRSLSHGR